MSRINVLPAGTVTPLHHDTIMLFHTQVVGRKRWRFISPLDTPRLYNHNNVFSPIDLDKPEDELYRETEAYCRDREGFKPIEEWRAEISKKIAAKLNA